MPEPRPVTFDTGPVVLTGDAYGNPAHRPVLLLHGGGQTRHAWGGTAATLADAGFHAVSLDLRGHGDSGWAPDADYRVDAFADDLCAVAAQLGRKPAVVGASLGGLALLVAMGERPDPPAAAVVLVDIAARADQVGIGRIIAFMTGAPDGFATLEDAADAVAAYTPHRPRPSQLDGLRKNLRQGADGRWRWHWDPQFIRGDRPPNATQNPERLEACARTLRVPTLLVRGRMSDVVSEDGAAHFLEVVPHARYADVAGAGHMVAGDRNDAFTRAVVGFLRALP
ncbi:MAG: alpha/beta fold hydrolase [bacterium]|nr:alpha/beta fold hydrolase [bacterium]